MKIIRWLLALPLFRRIRGGTTFPVERRKEFYHAIAQSNLSRTLLFSIVLFLTNSVLLLRDIFVTRPTGIWETNILYKHLFYLHVMLETVTFLVLVFCLPLRRSFLKHSRPAFTVGITFAFTILVWCAVIAAWVNYPAHGQITEYIMGILGIAAVFSFHPAVSGLLFFCAQTAFMILLAMESSDPNSTGLYTNSIVFLLIAWSLSIVSYASRKREFMSKKTIEEQTSALLQANTELQESNDQLALLNTEKNEIIQIAAHDLKNPLTNIILASDLLATRFEMMKHEEVQRYIGMVRITAERMEEIITNILHSNAIESGRVHYEPELLDLCRIVCDVAEQYRVRATIKGIIIITETPEQLFVRTDRNALLQILDNLISNAVKYSSQGNIIVRALFLPEVYQPTHESAPLSTRRGRWARIEVHDEGPGLTEDDQGKLFGKFARLSARPTANENSTGLGLSIVKKLVEMMGGRVWCDSKPGQGAVFIVECPAENMPVAVPLS